MAKVYDTATDIITFARSSSGTALRRVGYGDELVVDGSNNWVGDFDVAADLGGWSQSGTTLASVSGGTATVSYNGGNATLSKLITVTAGKVYRVTGSISNVVSTGPRFKLGSSFGANDYLNAQSAGDYDEIIVATSDALSIYVQCIGAGSLEVDNISVKEVIFDRATDPLVLFNHPDDTPRIEYGSDGSLKGLLIEEQRTNLLTHSEDFSNAAWDKVGAVTVDSTLVTGPDGTLSGRRVLNCADAAGDRLVELVSITNATLTGSMWVKGEGDNIGKDIQLTVKRTGGTFVGTTVSHTLTADWERIHATFTQDPTNTAARLVLVNPANGNEASEVLIYGAQLEAGSFPTSYIPTSGSQVTRWADVASIPVSAFGYNQTAGTWVVNWTNGPDVTAGQQYLLFITGPGGNLVYSNAGNAASYAYDGSNVLAHGSWVADQEQTIAVAMSPTEVSSSLDGAAVNSSAHNGNLTADRSRTVYLGDREASPRPLNGHIKSLSYYPRRLTNTQLQELTA